MPSHRYRVVDVFTKQPLEGNPLAVFPDSSSIDAVTMQRIARELSLPETAFILPPTRAGADMKLRIFSPSREMDFAGHPTIGTAFVMNDEGMISKGRRDFKLEENIGLVPIRLDEGMGGKIWLTTPPIKFGTTYDPAVCAEKFGLAMDDLLDIPPQLVDAGNPTIFIPLKSKDAVDRAWIDKSGLNAIKGEGAAPACAFTFTSVPEGAYSRMFAPEYGIAEDAATGSSTGPLAAYMMKYGLLPKISGTSFTSEQGTKMGRRSFLHVEIRGEGGKDAINVGGGVIPVIDATLHL